MRVFVAGEGPSELGDWAHHVSYRAQPPRPGVLEALLRRVRASGWEIVGSTTWKSIRKYRALPQGGSEIRNVLGVALLAKEAGCDVLAFSRDRDGDQRREADVAAGVARVTQVLEGPRPSVVGGVAVEMVESWLLSIRGHQGSESLRHPKQNLPAMTVEQMVRVIEEANFEQLPKDAKSLSRWLALAASALAMPREPVTVE